MNRFCLYFFVCCFSNLGYSQEEFTIFEGDTIYNVVEVYPEFPGGAGALKKYIAKNVKYPESAQYCPLTGIYVRFVVSKTGTISNVKVVKKNEECPELDEMVIKFFKEMPKWTPATIDGKPVNCYYNSKSKICLN